MNWRLLRAKNYQIRWLTAGQTSVLRDSGVPFESNDDGILIDADHLPNVLAVLEAEVISTFHAPAKRVDEVVLKFAQAGHESVAHLSVKFDTDIKPKDPRVHLLSLVREQFLPTVKSNIVIHLAVGGHQEPIRDNDFHIFVDSAPRTTEAVSIPERIWGIPVAVEKNQAAYLATGDGVPIVDFDEEFAIGELVGNCLYLHFDLLGRKPSDRQLAVFLRVLQRTQEELSADDVLADVIETLDPADMRGLDRLSVRFDDRMKRFGKQTLAVVRHVLLPTVRKNIIVHLGGGAQAPVHDENFHVYLYGVPKQTTGIDVPARVWDISVADRRQAWALSDIGIPVIDYDSDFVPAEIVGNCLYIHFGVAGDLFNRLTLLARILKEAVRELDVDAFVAEIVESLPDDGVPCISTREARGYGVAVEGFNPRSQQVIAAVVSHMLVPAVACDVHVGHCAGENQRPLRDRRFHVFFQSSPFGDMSAKAPGRLFGLPVTHREGAFWPSGRGIAIADEAGFLIAELVEKNLFIHQTIVNRGTRVEAEILARLLSAVRKVVVSRNSGSDELASLYEGECFRQLERHRREQAGSSENAAESERALREAVHETMLKERHLCRLERADHLGGEYDELLAIDKVRDVRVDGASIIVQTDLLYCVDPRTGVTHEIGAFDIHIPTGGGDVLWMNKTRQVWGEAQNMNAPHVQVTGKACYGNTKDVFPALISQRQFATVIVMAIAFVESVNTDDLWGKHVHNWPVAHLG